jgi:hypothetical protein
MTGAQATLRVPETFFDGGSIADAFHGTLEGAAQVIAEKGFRATVEAGQQYGPGIYFFESDYAAACWFATRKRHESGSAQRPVVVQAQVNLGRVFYANVIAAEVEKARKELTQQLGQEVPALVVFRLVCSILCQKGLIDSVKIVRTRVKREVEAENYNSEIVLLTYDPKRVVSRVLKRPEDLRRNHTVSIDLR